MNRTIMVTKMKQPRTQKTKRYKNILFSELFLKIDMKTIYYDYYNKRYTLNSSFDTVIGNLKG